MAIEKDKVQKNSSEKAGFVLYYQPLLRFETQMAAKYIEGLRVALKDEKDLKLNSLLTDPNPSPFCTKHGFKSCHHLLYKTKDCIPKKQVASLFCPTKAKKIDAKDFSEPVFKRIEWNRLALKINRHCFLKQSDACGKLAAFKKEFQQKFEKNDRERKKKLNRDKIQSPFLNKGQ